MSYIRSFKTTVPLWLVLFVIFIDWIGIGLVYPMFSTMLFHKENILLPPETSETVRGIYLGLLLAAMPIAQFFSGPVMGTLSDSRGRKPLFLLSLSLAVIGYGISMLGVFIKSIFLLIASRLIVGVAAGNAAVVSATISDVSEEHNKTKNFGLYGTACGLGFTLGPFLGGKFSETSFLLPFFLAFICTLINLLCIAFLLPETNKQRKNSAPSLMDGLRNLKKAFYMKGLRPIFLTIFIFSFGWSFFYEFIPVVWISHYSMPPATIGLFYAYGAGFYALCASFLIQPIVNRYKKPPVLFYSLGFLGTLILALLCQPSSLWIWIYLPLVNFFVALLEPTSTVMVSDWAKKDSQGEVLGIFQSVQSVAWALSPLAAGPLLGIHTSMPMLLGGLTILLAATIFGILLRKEIFLRKH
jgi:DHA1 family tetracycline resistance protein-like MFS transporter